MIFTVKLKLKRHSDINFKLSLYKSLSDMPKMEIYDALYVEDFGTNIVIKDRGEIHQDFIDSWKAQYKLMTTPRIIRII